ncbi:hypothetical protein [Dongia deserti]|uniref:hypothetical protein n=1 Tax=Dongia deserti TaxID=2268030 RepID=UPI000E65E7E4|nr:hypothetical protein [Dongia deserti]
MGRDDRNPRHHTSELAARLEDTITELREDIQKVDEPKFKAMCETSAEVLQALVKTFRDYDAGQEAAWRERT